MPVIDRYPEVRAFLATMVAPKASAGAMIEARWTPLLSCAFESLMDTLCRIASSLSARRW